MKRKSIKDIPNGYYCYRWLEEPSKENNFKGKIKLCPYYSSILINKVKVPWCKYLNQGGTSNYWTVKEWFRVERSFKTEKEMDKKLPLTLLWDGCKECGINE